MKKTSNVPNCDQLDLLEFKLNRARCTIRAEVGQKIRKDDIPGEDEGKEVTVKSKCRKMVPILSNEVRFDMIEHLQNRVKLTGQTCCRNPGCSGKSTVNCAKCDISVHPKQ